MQEQNSNEQKPNLIEQLSSKRFQIDTSDLFKKFEENQKGINNSMNSIGIEETKPLDKGMDI